jgi:hypothetical protein
VPLNEAYIRAQAKNAKRMIIVDEGRHSAGVGEGIITAIVEGGYGARPFQRVVGADTFTPLAGAAFLVIPSEEDIVAAADRLAAKVDRLAREAREQRAFAQRDAVAHHRHIGALDGQHRERDPTFAIARGADDLPQRHRADIDVGAGFGFARAFEQREPAFDLAEEVRARDDLLARVAPLFHAEGVQAVEREHLRRPLFGLRGGKRGKPRRRSSARQRNSDASSCAASFVGPMRSVRLSPNPPKSSSIPSVELPAKLAPAALAGASNEPLA